MNETLFSRLRAATATIQKTLISNSDAMSSLSGTLRGLRGGFVPGLLAQLGVHLPANNGEDVDKNRWQCLSETDPANQPESDVISGGQFLTKSFTSQAGTRTYKLYIPSGYQGQPLPVVVMLHGCTQNPDDFARGTRMNEIAEEQLCIVIYPAQASSANSSKCWNWFKSIDQQRDQGEPSIIAGITREVVREYGLDASKVYVSGLSSGGAMAVIMATTYPELYAAVGVHSGLPYAAAHDLPSAFAAMRGSARGTYPQNKPGSECCPTSVPIIVFHGDQDTTVNACNGNQLIKDNVAEFIGDNHLEGGKLRKPDVISEEGKVPGGHRYTRISHHDESGHTLAEHWVIHGAGHAWAGGSENGSYTDSKGPDASREMMRFFYSHSLLNKK